MFQTSIQHKQFHLLSLCRPYLENACIPPLGLHSSLSSKQGSYDGGAEASVFQEGHCRAFPCVRANLLQLHSIHDVALASLVMLGPFLSQSCTDLRPSSVCRDGKTDLFEQALANSIL